MGFRACANGGDRCRVVILSNDAEIPVAVDLPPQQRHKHIIFAFILSCDVTINSPEQPSQKQLKDVRAASASALLSDSTGTHIKLKLKPGMYEEHQ